jgi:hypothetical protein
MFLPDFNAHLQPWQSATLKSAGFVANFWRIHPTASYSSGTILHAKKTSLSIGAQERQKECAGLQVERGR